MRPVQCSAVQLRSASLHKLQLISRIWNVFFLSKVQTGSMHLVIIHPLCLPIHLSELLITVHRRKAIYPMFCTTIFNCNTRPNSPQTLMPEIAHHSHTLSPLPPRSPFSFSHSQTHQPARSTIHLRSRQEDACEMPNLAVAAASAASWVHWGWDKNAPHLCLVGA